MNVIYDVITLVSNTGTSAYTTTAATTAVAATVAANVAANVVAVVANVAVLGFTAGYASAPENTKRYYNDK